QQAVHLQIALPRQFHRIVLDRQEPAPGELPKASAEYVEDVLAELLLEVTYVEMPGLQLQNHLTDEQLVRPNRQRPAQRQLVTVEQAHVIFPGIDVLHVETIDVAKRRDAGAEHICPVPETITVDKFH